MTEILKLGGASFQPSAANTGNEQATILRGKNMMLRGSEGSFYFECYGGNLDLNEQVPMKLVTGTLSWNEGELEVFGIGTAFKAELRFGQKIKSGDQVFVVDDVITDELFRCQRAPDGSDVDQIAYKLPHLFPLDNKRGSQIWGNSLKFDRGNIVSVGEGIVCVNGQALAGTTLEATRRLQLAIYDPEFDIYTVENTGIEAPDASGVSITVETGATNQATPGFYSFLYSWANKETAYGFSNPSGAIKTDALSAPLQLLAAGDRFKLDFTTALASKPSNANAIVIFRSLFSDASQNATQAGEGSWFVAKTIDIADLDGGVSTYVDVLDGDLGTEVTFNNDLPVDADWVTVMAGDPVLLSCAGEKTVAKPNGTSPGPFLYPSKRGNREAFPAEIATPLSPPDTIIGFVPSVGRVFLMTKVGLPFASSTGQADFPITTRPFWQTGFKSPYGLVFVNDALYAFTSKGVTRSIATGDEASEQYAFAASAEDITRDWYAGYVHAVHDPANELVVFIYSAAYRNEGGFWVSLALPFYLRYGFFGPLITLEKTDRDMIVCGAAAIDGHLQFLAGGLAQSSIPTGTPGTGGGLTEEVRLVCGFECGCSTTDNSFNAHVQSLTGAMSFVTTPVRTGGKRALRANPSSSAPSVTMNHEQISTTTAGAGDIFVIRFYIRFATLPSADTMVMWLRDFNAGIVFKNSTSTLHCGGKAAATLETAGPGKPVVINTWYCIDALVNHNVGQRTVDAQVDGEDLIQSIDMMGANPSNGVRFGSSESCSGDWYYDDVVISKGGADYPLGPGHISPFIPTSDGTHSIGGVDRFERTETGTDIDNSTTDAYSLINKVPIPTYNEHPATYIKTTNNPVPADYIEINLAPISGIATPTVAPRWIGSIFGFKEYSVAPFTDIGIWEFLLRSAGAEVSLTLTGGVDFEFSELTVEDGPVGDMTIVTSPAAGDDWHDLSLRFSVPDADALGGLSAFMLEVEFAE